MASLGAESDILDDTASVESCIDLTGIDPSDQPDDDTSHLLASNPFEDSSDKEEQTPEFPNIEDVVVAEPSTPADARPKPSETTTTRRRRRGNPKSRGRVSYTSEMTAFIMNLFMDQRQAGGFNSTKKKDYTPAWNATLEAMKEKYPTFPWSIKSISDKYENEKKRYRSWRNFMAISGVNLNRETMLPGAPDAVWESFFARNNTRTRSVNWLRTVPLGDSDVYATVFFRERATGSKIREPGDTVARDSDESDNSATGEADEGIHAGARSSTQTTSREPSSAPSMRATSRPRVSAATKRRRADPDENSHLDDDIEEVDLLATNTSTTAAVKRAKVGSTQHNAQKIMSTIENAATALVAATTAAMRHPSADDITKAQKDLLDRFKDQLAKGELLKCINVLRDASWAVTWNNLPDDLKEGYVDQWKQGLVVP
jgi:Myb/SANT-like DNA-binding domain